MLFNHCYVNNSICTPSRAAILTGTHSHVNGVMTLDHSINNLLPMVHKHLKHGGYHTGFMGKWHLGEGPAHYPRGFDHWDALPGQGAYFDPVFINEDGQHVEKGYVTDIITDKAIDYIREASKDSMKPYFLMCHHKAPHRPWECDPKHADLYAHDIKVPETFNDDYRHRAKAAAAAKMRVAEDMTYLDLGLVQPEGGEEIGEIGQPGVDGLDDRSVRLFANA